MIVGYCTQLHATCGIAYHTTNWRKFSRPEFRNDIGDISSLRVLLPRAFLFIARMNSMGESTIAASITFQALRD
jgi:hypothetical protein